MVRPWRVYIRDPTSPFRRDRSPLHKAARVSQAFFAPNPPLELEAQLVTKLVGSRARSETTPDVRAPEQTKRPTPHRAGESLVPSLEKQSGNDYPCPVPVSVLKTPLCSLRGFHESASNFSAPAPHRTLPNPHAHHPEISPTVLEIPAAMSSAAAMEAIDELVQLSESMRQAASLLADDDPSDETASRRPSTFLNAVALGNVVSAPPSELGTPGSRRRSI